jgi:hypothetical protein
VTDRSPADQPPTRSVPSQSATDGRPPLSFPKDNGGSRRLFIFTPSVRDPSFLRQKELLDEGRDGLVPRGLVMVEVIGADLATEDGHTVAAEEAARLRTHWHAESGVFTVVLAGADGTELLRANQPMSTGPLFSMMDGRAEPRDGRGPRDGG